jgi:hypothetical protein
MTGAYRIKRGVIGVALIAGLVGIGRPVTAQEGESGPRIAYSLMEGNTSGIWTANYDDTDRRQLTGGALDIYPVWSTDGEQIAFIRMAQSPETIGGPADLMVIRDEPDAEPQALVSGAMDLGIAVAVGGGPLWSPDGSSIAYLWAEEGAGALGAKELRVVNVQDGTERSLAPVASLAAYDWSPGGSQLILLELGLEDEHAVTTSLELIDVDGQDHQPLELPGDLLYGNVRWLEDGRIAVLGSKDPDFFSDIQPRLLLIDSNDLGTIQTIVLDHPLLPLRLLEGGTELLSSLEFSVVPLALYGPAIGLDPPAAAYMRYDLDQPGVGSPYCGLQLAGEGLLVHLAAGPQSLSADRRYCAVYSFSGDTSEIKVFIEDAVTHDRTYFDLYESSSGGFASPVISFKP